MNEPARRYLIWSNQHGAWWRPNQRGYTTVIEWAGTYSEAEAREIIRLSSLGRQTTARDNLRVYADAVVPNEVMVPCPPAEAPSR